MRIISCGVYECRALHSKYSMNVGPLYSNYSVNVGSLHHKHSVNFKLNVGPLHRKYLGVQECWQRCAGPRVKECRAWRIT